MNESNFFGKLQEIMMMDDFMDITLVCDDRTEFRAHRNILSAFSPVIRQMLQLNAKSSHPVVFLRGVKKQEMESILKFIYLGEVSFNQSRMDEFLAVADILEVRELRESFGSSDPPKNVENGIDFDDFAVAQNSSTDYHLVQDQEANMKSPNEEGQTFGNVSISHDKSKTSTKDPLMYNGVQLFPPDKRKSSSLAWEHGGFVKMSNGVLDRSHLICSHCGDQLKYSGSPSMLATHVERRHYDQWVSALLCKDSRSSLADFSSPAQAVEVKELKRSFRESQELDNAKKESNYEGFAFTHDSRTVRDNTEQISSRESSQSFEDFSGSHGSPLGASANTNKGPGKGSMMYKDIHLFPPDLRKKSSTRSHVWEHGGFAKMEDGSLNKSHVICRHCGTHIKYNGSPSNLGNHVERFHNDEWMSTLCKDKTVFSSPTKPELNWSQIQV